MKFQKNNMVASPEILRRKLGGELFVPVTVATEAFTQDVCKAGTPLTETGTIASGADAVGILLYDVYSDNPNGSLIKGFATINTEVAEAYSGITYSDEIKTALNNIVFE